MQNTPFDERYLQRRLAALEKRLAALETAPRAGNTSISGGKLTVGAPDSPDRIEIDATAHTIRFNSSDGPADVYSPGGAAGTMLYTSEPAGQTFATFGADGYVGNTPNTETMAVERVDGGTRTTQATIDVTIQDAGGGNSAGQVSLNAVGTPSGAPDLAVIDLFSDGGVTIFNRNREVDMPSPGPGAVTLYVKANRLYYRDGAGTVRGPL